MSGPYNNYGGKYPALKGTPPSVKGKKGHQIMLRNKKGGKNAWDTLPPALPPVEQPHGAEPDTNENGEADAGEEDNHDPVQMALLIKQMQVKMEAMNM